MNNQDEGGLYASRIGLAAIALWSELPRDIQERLFEKTVEIALREGDVRENLARFLHDHHPRTAEEPSNPAFARPAEG
jgi:hypothetical protein